MAPPAGFEPATLALTAPCSTAELQGNTCVRGKPTVFPSRTPLSLRGVLQRRETLRFGQIIQLLGERHDSLHQRTLGQYRQIFAFG